MLGDHAAIIANWWRITFISQFIRYSLRCKSSITSCADPEGTDPPPLKNHKNIGFSSNIGPDSPKNRKTTKPAFDVWAFIDGMPAKRHLMAFRWRAEDGQLIVILGSTLPSSTKKHVSWIPSDKTFCIRACSYWRIENVGCNVLKSTFLLRKLKSTHIISFFSKKRLF